MCPARKDFNPLISGRFGTRDTAKSGKKFTPLPKLSMKQKKSRKPGLLVRDARNLRREGYQKNRITKATKKSARRESV
jgi:hypothetical protein